ncbi:hypothetical protein [Fodinicola acaciae]|uniref:hypothetical protein n=1 Tax=Fodinicola acaciae TaxID=2681555 RepID=UPI0013D4F3A6|nr:hypothetical protein [Fodinicola acaciae]
MKRVIVAVAVAVCAVVVLTVGWAVFGQVGAWMAGLAVATVVVGTVALRLGGDPPPAKPARSPPLSRQVRAGRLVSAAGWNGGSQRDWDTTVRPSLLRLVDVLLSERFQTDHVRRPDLARELLGDQLWTLLDPDRGVCEDRAVPGPERAALARILTRLEA